MKQYIAHLTVTRSFAIEAKTEAEAFEKAQEAERTTSGVTSGCSWEIEGLEDRREIIDRLFNDIQDAGLDESSAFDETETQNGK